MLEVGQLHGAQDHAAETPVGPVDAPAERQHPLAGQARDDRAADLKAQPVMRLMDLEVLAVRVVARPRRHRADVVGDVALRVDHQHHAQVAGGRGAVEQDELAHPGIGLREAGGREVLHGRLEREVVEFGIARDVAFQDLQQVPGRLLGPVPGVPAQVGQHQPGDRDHADRGQHAQRAPRPR